MQAAEDFFNSVPSSHIRFYSYKFHLGCDLSILVCKMKPLMSTLPERQSGSEVPINSINI